MAGIKRFWNLVFGFDCIDLKRFFNVNYKAVLF